MIEELLQQILDRIDHRYYGKYRGYVHKVDDPLNLGRVQAVVPRLFGDTPLGWALPCTPYAGPDQGFYTVPDLGSAVWIEFEGGDPASPIWSGMWWGRPEAADAGQPDSTAAEVRTTPEVPQHGHPLETAVPGVRILKSSAGHYIVMDDRAGQERLEIHDNQGNRVILNSEGIVEIASNHRILSKGNRGVQVHGNDKLRVGGDLDEEIGGSTKREVSGGVVTKIRGTLEESARDGAYLRKFDSAGLTETVSGPRKLSISGSDERRVAGAVSEVTGGGYGLSAGGAVSISAAGASVSISASNPDLPSLNAISLDAALGNVSINTKLGMLQLGGMSATSPIVIGDGLAIHHQMLAMLMRSVYPLLAGAYGPLFDAWAAMTPLNTFSLFGFVKRLPVG
jgi:type VI secretion system secreted protein VgrG